MPTHCPHCEVPIPAPGTCPHKFMEVFQHGDGAHCGISDLYPEHQAALEKALASGKPFDTGWFSSKKEIVTGRVWSDGQTVTCEASCSDDFDTQGKGEAEAYPASGTVVLFADVVRALDDALDQAGKNKTANEPYAGFSIHHAKRCWSVYSGGKPQGKSHIAQAWIETLIMPRGDGHEMETPPGDNYHTWGWQQDGKVPQKVRDVLYRWAENFLAGKKVGGKRTVDGWTIKPWKDEA